jgi:O-6-methylguanine DNA methyltransferase
MLTKEIEKIKFGDNKISYNIVETEISNFLAIALDGKLVWFDYVKRHNLKNKLSLFLKRRKGYLVKHEEHIFTKASYQIEEYLARKRDFFELDIVFFGTDLQKKVWDCILAIPVGETITYTELAQKIENPKAIRPAASATANNTLPIIVPCHRVVNKNHSKCGYAGGIEIKNMLLDLEK